MSEKKNTVINEMFDVKFTLMFAVVTVVMLFCAVYLHGYSGSSLQGAVLTVARCWAYIMCVASPVMLVRCLLCRVRIDENGVDVSNPFTGRMDFRWNELHTAAVVKIGMGGTRSQPVIILSSLDPAQVLTRNALVNGKGLSRREHVRIMYSKARREAVEHYLRMTLPEIDI